ncbi:hypothetical protein TNCV_530971 [Trichonephila clavipes]|nr:hypothetical protein TNCV_530971 [Trichonephila clavipes]
MQPMESIRVTSSQLLLGRPNFVLSYFSLLIFYATFQFQSQSRVECPQGTYCFVYPCLEATGACAANGMKNGVHGQRNGTTFCLQMNHPASACNITMIGFEFGDTVLIGC